MRRTAPYYAIIAAAAAVFLAIWMTRDEKQMVRAERFIEKSHATHKAAHAHEYVTVWLPRAALANLGICVLLLAAGPWLTRRADAPPAAPANPEPAPGAQRLLCIVTATAIVSSAVLNHPRLGQSLWGDEESTMRRSVVGEYMPDASGKLVWNPVEWGEALWHYRDPNNHPLFSVLAKISHSLWPPADDPEGWYFHETALRLPAYLFGLAGLAAVALLAQALRMPIAGMLAVVWLALHPWHVRYGVDARGYALLFLWIPLVMLALWNAVRTGRWAWWIGYGLLEFLVLWSYPGGVYFLLALNITAVALVLRRGLPAAWRWMLVKRWIVGNAVGVVLTVQLLMPCVPPMLLYLQGSRLRGQLTADWLSNTASQLLTGIHLQGLGSPTLGASWAVTGKEHPLLMAAVFAVVLVPLLCGIVRFWKLGGAHRILICGLLLPAPLMVFLSAASGNILYAWYVLIGLPGLAVLVGAGLELLVLSVQRRRRGLLGCGAAAACLIIFGVGTAPQNRVLRRFSAEPNRESIAAIRTQRNPRTADLSKVMTLPLVMHTRGYDPAGQPIHSLAELEEKLREADQRKIPAYIHFANWALAMQGTPDVMAALQNPERFEMLPPFPGLESFSTRFVFRYKGPAPGGSLNNPP